VHRGKKKKPSSHQEQRGGKGSRAAEGWKKGSLFQRGKKKTIGGRRVFFSKKESHRLDLRLVKRNSSLSGRRGISKKNSHYEQCDIGKLGAGVLFRGRIARVGKKRKENQPTSHLSKKGARGGYVAASMKEKKLKEGKGGRLFRQKVYCKGRLSNPLRKGSREEDIPSSGGGRLRIGPP